MWVTKEEEINWIKFISIYCGAILISFNKKRKEAETHTHTLYKWIFYIFVKYIDKDGDDDSKKKREKKQTKWKRWKENGFEFTFLVETILFMRVFFNLILERARDEENHSSISKSLSLPL